MIFSQSPIKNTKKSARYYTLKNFKDGIGKNVLLGKKLKNSRGLSSFCEHTQDVVGIQGIRDILYAYGANGILYYVDESGDFAQTYDGVVASMPCVLSVFDGEKFVILMSDGASVYTHPTGGGGLALVEGVEPFTLACFAYERLWTYNDGVLRFSAPLEFSNFTVGKNGGGEILVPDTMGNVLALIPYENRVYIFRENGIQRLDTRGEQTDFAISDCVFMSENIVKDTIAVGSECIYFATESAVYKLAVSSVSKVYTEYFEKYGLKPISAAYAQGKYVLSANNGESAALYVFNKDGLEIIDVQADCVVSIVKDGKTMPVILSRGKLYTLKEGILTTAVWRSNMLDLGQGAREKILERVKLCGSGNFTLSVSSNKCSRKLGVAFRNGVADLAVTLCGDYFGFCLESQDGNCVIDGMSCLYTLTKGGKL